MNLDLETLKKALDGCYPNGIISPLMHQTIRILEGFEARLRELEKRFEDTEG